jgi:hypothetical protein
MADGANVRWGSLRFMYVITIVSAGAAGIGMLFTPEVVKAVFQTSCDASPYGMIGATFLAFGLLSILGLRDPLKFTPVLLLQLTYGLAWIGAVLIPLVATGKFPATHLPIAVIFVVIVVGDLIAIPFRYVFSGQMAT